MNISDDEKVKPESIFFFFFTVGILNHTGYIFYCISLALVCLPFFVWWDKQGKKHKNKIAIYILCSLSPRVDVSKIVFDYFCHFDLHVLCYYIDDATYLFRLKWTHLFITQCRLNLKRIWRRLQFVFFCNYNIKQWKNPFCLEFDSINRRGNIPSAYCSLVIATVKWHFFS